MWQLAKHALTVLLVLIQQGNAQLVFLLLYWLELLAEAACQHNIIMLNILVVKIALLDAPHALLHHVQHVIIYIGYMGQIAKHALTVLLVLIQQGNAQLVFLLLYWLELLAEAACQHNIIMLNILVVKIALLDALHALLYHAQHVMLYIG